MGWDPIGDIGKGIGDVGNWLGARAGDIGNWLGLGTSSKAEIGPVPQYLPQREYGPATPLDLSAADIEMGLQGGARAGQAELIAALQAQAAGRGPSLAQMQLQQATDIGLKQAMALGAAQQGQGLGGPTVLRNIADQQALMQQQAAGQSAQMRAMEQLQAQGQLGQMLGGMRGQDIGLATQQAQQKMAMQQLQQQTGLGWGQLQQAQEAGLLAAQSRADLGYAGLRFQAEEAAAGRRGGLLSGAGSAAMKAAGASDGGLVGGRPLVRDDDSYNDTQPFWLSPGEAVIPRSIVQSKNAPSKAAEFIDAIKKTGKTAGEMASDGGLTEWNPENLAASQPVWALPGEAIAQPIAQSVWAPRGSPPSSITQPVLAPQVPPPVSMPPLAARGTWTPPLVTLQGTQAPPLAARGTWTPAGKTEDDRDLQVIRGTPDRQAPEKQQLGAQGISRPQPERPARGLDLSGYEAAKKQMVYGAEEQGRALEAAAKTAEEKGQEVARLKQQEAIEASKLEAGRLAMQTEYQTTFNKWREDTQTLVQKYGDAKVDPKRLFQDATTGQKALAAIGLALGGLGASATGGVNRAVQTLENMITQDIDAQKTNLEKMRGQIGQRQMLLGEMRETYGETMAAMSASKAAIKERYVNMLEGIGAKYAGTETANRAAELIAGLKLSQGKDLAMIELEAKSKSANQAVENEKLRLEQQRLGLDTRRIEAAMGSGGMSQKQQDALGRAQSATETIMELEKLHGQIGAGAYVGGAWVPGSTSDDYDEFLRAHAISLATALRPGGVPPRTVDEAMNVLKESGVPSPQKGYQGARRQFGNLRRAIYAAQGMAVPSEQPEIQLEAGG